LPLLEHFGGGATNVCDDNMPGTFEDNDESVLIMLESSDCLFMPEDLLVEEDRPLSLKENMSN